MHHVASQTLRGCLLPLPTELEPSELLQPVLVFHVIFDGKVRISFFRSRFHCASSPTTVLIEISLLICLVHRCLKGLNFEEAEDLVQHLLRIPKEFLRPQEQPVTFIGEYLL